MKLIDFSVEERKDLAVRMGVSYVMAYRWSKGWDNMSKNKSIEIEDKTDGRVSRCEAMFPEIDFSKWRIT